MDPRDMMVMIRGGGDLGSGVAHRLFQCGFPVVILELEQPRMLRRTVSFGNAMYEGSLTIDGIAARKVDWEKGIQILHDKLGKGNDWEGLRQLIAVVLDPDGQTIKDLQPQVLIDARMAKANLGTTKDDASLVIGLGPGFTAGEDCHSVIETMRGHHLGRVIDRGSAAADTGTPGEVGGQSATRVLRSPAAGALKHKGPALGATLQAGAVVAEVAGQPVTAAIDGILRGLMQDGLEVAAGEKIGDVDPRPDVEMTLISDKARAVAGGVLEAVLYAYTRDGLFV